MSPSSRRIVPAHAALAVALVVALLGGLLVVLGWLQATIWAPGDRFSARLDGIREQPVVVTDVGLLELDGPSVRVDASAPGRPVFLGIGRAADVDAYLGKVARTDLSGRNGEALTSTSRPGDTVLPDPAGVDVWATSVRAQNTASIVWPDVEGDWKLVAGTDGTANGPQSVAMTWTLEEQSSAAPAVITVGVVLLVGGAVAGGVLFSRRPRGGGGGSAAPAVPAVPVAAAPPAPAPATRRAARASESPDTNPRGLPLPVRTPGRSAAPGAAGAAPARTPTPAPTPSHGTRRAAREAERAGRGSNAPETAPRGVTLPKDDAAGGPADPGSPTDLGVWR